MKQAPSITYHTPPVELTKRDIATSSRVLVDDFLDRIKARWNHFKDSRAKSHAADPAETKHYTDSEDDTEYLENPFADWLKRFAIYLGAVTAACLTGLYFLWQIPLLQNLPHMLDNLVNDMPTPRTETATAPKPQDPLVSQTAPPPTVPVPSAPSAPSVSTVPSTQTAPTAPTAPSQALDPTVDVSAIAASTPPTIDAPPDAPLDAPADAAAGLDGAATTLATAPTTPATTAEIPANAAGIPTLPAVPALQPLTETTPPPTPTAEIGQLLAEAQQQMDNRRFIAPNSGNALRTYQRVLELEPNNPAALNGIESIALYYRDTAARSLRQGRTDESLAYIKRGLRAAPADEALLNLQREARAAKQRENRQREEARRLQAQRELQQRQQAEQRRRAELQRERELEAIQDEQSFRPRRNSEQPERPWWQQPAPADADSAGFNQR